MNIKRLLTAAAGVVALFSVVGAGCASTSKSSTGTQAPAASAPATPSTTLQTPALTSTPTTAAPVSTAPPTTAAPPVTAAAAPAAPAGCHPLSNENTCYEPGEYCRDSDHGVTGVAGDGKSITCEDNNGWRWEAPGDPGYTAP
jgi:hypothetical protein